MPGLEDMRFYYYPNNNEKPFKGVKQPIGVIGHIFNRSFCLQCGKYIEYIEFRKYNYVIW